MTPLFTLALLAFLTLGPTGCATIIALADEDGLAQKITFNSDPPGVKLFLNGTTPLGETPLARKIERSEHLFIIAKKEGFEDQQIHLKHRFNNWFWGNFIFGGAIGSTIDYADGAVVQLDPTTYYITMTPNKLSLEQTQQRKTTQWARNFMLVGYSFLQVDLAKGEGEYLSSLLALLNVQAWERAQSVGKLKRILAETNDPSDFVEQVLKDYGWPTF